MVAVGFSPRIWVKPLSSLRDAFHFPATVG